MIALFALLLTGWAYADSEPSTELFEGVRVLFDDGISVCLPADWLVVEEIPEELVEDGVYYIALSSDATNTFQIAWKSLRKEITLEAAQNEMAAFHSDTQIVDTQTERLLYYTDAENNMMVFIMLDPVETGMYMFCFTPAEEEFVEMAVLIADSIRYELVGN